ncbi:hypothetical protein KO500_15990 [Cellulophaga baltica]|uniref:hypothetical protein n=1 Tax=Cellulophaga TaxID=104264 RepID=UPI001C07D58C|nr:MULTISPECIES: hypothetical protein [Cellulophaga]MBU2997944.1 hypothetical protein [Cellulophaga baltica]MDO6769345.1 hypothetical protein [Cellulophaga sp. 1_MG-2023]
MKIKKTLTTAILIIFFTIGYSQTTKKKNQLEFSIGYNSGSLKNLEFAPISRYDYKDIIYKLNYERTSKKQNIFEIELDFFDRTALKSKNIPSLNAHHLKADLSFSYLKQIHNKNAFSIHLGLQSLSNLTFLYNKTDYFAIHQEFGFASLFGYQLNEKQYLSSKLTIPFVLVRMTNNGGSVESFKRYQSVKWNFKYGYVLSKYFDLKITYDFMYNRLQIPSAYRELQHQINLGIIYKF